MSITCLKCLRVSHHTKDIEERFCSACGLFHDQMTFTTGDGKTIQRHPGYPPSRLDAITDCCKRPLGVCNLDPCETRKAQWKQIAQQPPGV